MTLIYFPDNFKNEPYRAAAEKAWKLQECLERIRELWGASADINLIMEKVNDAYVLSQELKDALWSADQQQEETLDALE